LQTSVRQIFVATYKIPQDKSLWSTWQFKSRLMRNKVILYTAFCVELPSSNCIEINSVASKTEYVEGRKCDLRIMFTFLHFVLTAPQIQCNFTQPFYLSLYLTNLMHKICFTISFISYLYMFRPHVLVHETATYRCDDTRGCVMQCWPPYDQHMVLETCRGMK